jgi:hypothetical protein
MLRFRDYSVPQRVAIVLVLVTIPLLCLATRTWPSTPMMVLPFLLPVSVTLLTWSLMKTESQVLSERLDSVAPARNVGLGIGAPQPSRLGGTIGIGGQMAVLLMSIPNAMFPRQGYPESMTAIYFVWTIAVSAFMVFGLPRLLRSPTIQ